MYCFNFFELLIKLSCTVILHVPRGWRELLTQSLPEQYVCFLGFVGKHDDVSFVLFQFKSAMTFTGTSAFPFSRWEGMLELVV